MFLNDSRKEYTKYQLDKQHAHNNPFDQFTEWFDFAKNNAAFEPNAMTLSTVANNQPSCRVVLLKKFDNNGFVFFTNYNSKKAQEMHENPKVAATFFWPKIERQIRIEGTINKISSSESDMYFNTRPRDSQLSAWASHQSEEVEDRLALERHLDDIKTKFPGEVPRPEFWGGYRLIPKEIEFWSDGEYRLHDRFVFIREDKWNMHRLYP